MGAVLAGTAWGLGEQPGEAGLPCAVLALIIWTGRAPVMKVGQLDAFLEATEKLLAIKWKELRQDTSLLIAWNIQ